MPGSQKTLCCYCKNGLCLPFLIFAAQLIQMSVVSEIKIAAASAISNLFNIEINGNDITVNATKPEFEGDYTIVLFSFVKHLKKSPDVLGNEIGEYLLAQNADFFSSFNVIKGFLNLVVADKYWLQFVGENFSNENIGNRKKNGERIMIEYSSPNTNKPLHLGHLRNNFLGWSMAEILKTSGFEIVKTCIVNDRGIHICKSMLAWQMFANGATPQSTGKKGDHFVGDYYVKFNDEYKKQVGELMASGKSKEEAERDAPVMKAAQQMLVDWEAGKPDIIELWKKMNSWVYEGFAETYKKIGTSFDRIYYESETYLLGKDLVDDGLQKAVFYKRDDGSVWADLTKDGMDEKLVQRKDGTSVYITQDFGLAKNKYEEYHCDESIYVVGNEQDYHFKALKIICEKLQIPAAENIFHLSYGMVELPSGKMKSREGTVVDADDIVQEMINIAKQKTEELGKVNDFNADELIELYNTIGLGALKFFLLRVDPKRKMIFNPEESIDFHGFTGPFVQYTHARIKSILRKEKTESNIVAPQNLLSLEKAVAIQLEQFSAIIDESAAEHDPSKIAIYVFNLAKIFNSFYAEHSIANAETAEKKLLRLQLAQLTAHTIKKAMQMLGINVPERM